MSSIIFARQQLVGMQSRLSAFPGQREAARIGAAADGHEADALGHVGVDDALDCFGVHAVGGIVRGLRNSKLS